MAWPAPEADAQRALTGYDLATTLLAEGRRSRLVARLREQLQIVESIDMDLTTLEQGSLVMLEACCPAEQIEAVEREVIRILAEAGTSAVSDDELKRGRQLVGNGLRFSLEAPGSVAAITGPQALWRAPQDPLTPLAELERWTQTSLQTDVLPALHPDKAFTLLALPGEAT